MRSSKDSVSVWKDGKVQEVDCDVAAKQCWDTKCHCAVCIEKVTVVRLCHHSGNYVIYHIYIITSIYHYFFLKNREMCNVLLKRVYHKAHQFLNEYSAHISSSSTSRPPSLNTNAIKTSHVLPQVSCEVRIIVVFASQGYYEIK